MSTNPTPPLTHRAKVLNDGLLDLAKWLADALPGIDGGEEALYEGLRDRMNDLSYAARLAMAQDTHGCESLMQCPHCIGNGSVGWECGDMSGTDPCETCDATGYLPASFEP